MRRRAPAPRLTRFTFKVRRPGDREPLVVEQLAETREWAHHLVAAFAALHWPGAEVEP